MPDVSLILGKDLREAGFRLVEDVDHVLELYHGEELLGRYWQHITTHSRLIADCEEVLAGKALETPGGHS